MTQPAFQPPCFSASKTLWLTGKSYYLLKRNENVAQMPLLYPCFWERAPIGHCMFPSEMLSLRILIIEFQAATGVRRMSDEIRPLTIHCLGSFQLQVRKARTQSHQEDSSGSRMGALLCCGLQNPGNQAFETVVLPLERETCCACVCAYSVHLFGFLPDSLLFSSWWCCHLGILGKGGYCAY